MTHNGKKSVHCEFCDFTTAYRTGMRTRMMGIHERIKPIKCSECETSFLINFALRRHILLNY